MIELVKHQIRHNLDFILENSYMNCHVKGLHSVVIAKQENGQYIRFFYTDPDHELWKNILKRNDIGFYFENDMSLAIHPHRSDLTLEVIKGHVLNYLFDRTMTEYSELQLTKYKYNSRIDSGNKCTFEKRYKEDLKFKHCMPYFPNDTFSLKARDLHTIRCNQNEINAWWVFEGNKDPDYQNICFSNCDPVIDNSFYKPMTKEKLAEIMKNTFNIDVTKL